MGGSGTSPERLCQSKSTLKKQKSSPCNELDPSKRRSEVGVVT